MYRLFRYAFIFNLTLLFITAFATYIFKPELISIAHLLLYLICPLIFINTVLFVFCQKNEEEALSNLKYKVNFKLQNGKLHINNVRRGVSIIGSAGSGKTESVVYNLLQHFCKHRFSGVIHDYKNFELTEIAYPLFSTYNSTFYTISFDNIYNRVNPIAPQYMVNEESVNEVSRVLIENLLEFKESGTTGTNKFFTDAAEGLIGGLIWKLKTDYPDYCTLPHLIAIYQYLDTDSLIAFLETNLTSKAMADAFINGKESSKQTAGVKSTLSNAFKKISSKHIFMVLSEDEVPLHINQQKSPSLISIVNNPKYETSYSPIIATIIHTITKQMSVRQAKSSFVMMEEAPTIRLLNMHRIPATLRSYDITTIYVMQDKIQNDMLYGDKASRAILSNLSYQFFGKVNDPDTAKYYERFFEIVKAQTTSVNQGHNLNFDTRITKSEKEVSKRRADAFFRLKLGEFIAFVDGKDQKVQFKLQHIHKEIPKQSNSFSNDDLQMNFRRIHREAQSLFVK